MQTDLSFSLSHIPDCLKFHVAAHLSCIWLRDIVMTVITFHYKFCYLLVVYITWRYITLRRDVTLKFHLKIERQITEIAVLTTFSIWIPAS